MLVVERVDEIALRTDGAAHVDMLEGLLPALDDRPLPLGRVGGLQAGGEQKGGLIGEENDTALPFSLLF